MNGAPTTHPFLDAQALSTPGSSDYRAWVGKTIKDYYAREFSNLTRLFVLVGGKPFTRSGVHEVERIAFHVWVGL